MPHLLWPFFNNNWPLLNDLFRCATRAMLKYARKLGIEVGIFCAQHTYGRQLNQHPHIHVSITRGGLDVKHGVWRDLFFKNSRSKKSGAVPSSVCYAPAMTALTPAPCLALATSVMRNSGIATCRRNISATGRSTSPKRPAVPGVA